VSYYEFSETAALHGTISSVWIVLLDISVFAITVAEIQVRRGTYQRYIRGCLLNHGRSVSTFTAVIVRGFNACVRERITKSGAKKKEGYSSIF